GGVQSGRQCRAPWQRWRGRRGRQPRRPRGAAAGVEPGPDRRRAAAAAVRAVQGLVPLQPRAGPGPVHRPAVRAGARRAAGSGQPRWRGPFRGLAAGGRRDSLSPTGRSILRGTGTAAWLEQRRLQRLDQAFAAHDLLELRTADRDIPLVAADLHLRAVLHGAALGVDPHVHRGLLAAVADRLDLLQLVGPGQQVLAALEQLAAEVGAQAVAQHRDAQAVDHLAQLPDLGAGQELGLVDQYAAEPAVGGDVLLHQAFQVAVPVEGRALGTQADARGDHPAAAATVVQPRRQDQGAHAALAVVVRRLQQRGGL